jgi:hypothetical protein
MAENKIKKILAWVKTRNGAILTAIAIIVALLLIAGLTGNLPLGGTNDNKVSKENEPAVSDENKSLIANVSAVSEVEDVAAPIKENKSSFDPHAGLINLPYYGWVSKEKADAINKSKVENPGLPANKFPWLRNTMSYSNWIRTEPIQMDYSGDTYRLRVEDNKLRLMYPDEIAPSYKAVFGNKTGFKYSDRGSGVNGQYVTVLNEGHVAYYNSTKDSYGRMKLLLPNIADSEDAGTFYALVERSPGNNIDRTKLQQSDFTNILWSDGRITNPSAKKDATGSATQKTVTGGRKLGTTEVVQGGKLGGDTVVLAGGGKLGGAEVAQGGKLGGAAEVPAGGKLGGQ